MPFDYLYMMYFQVTWVSEYLYYGVPGTAIKNPQKLSWRDINKT